ncbi:MAG: pentapeptide repeat-containing protein [Candidatus Saccharimonadales bacterium]
MIHSPIAPKILSQLDIWGGIIENELDIDGFQVESRDFSGIRRLNIEASRINKVTVMGTVLENLELSDVECLRLEGAALQAYKTFFLRVNMVDCRLTGAEFAEGHFEDCTFKNVKFDQAGFRFASFKRVIFDSCVLEQADFSNAKLTDVTFTDCSLDNSSFVSASCTNVDVTSEDLTMIKGVLGLKGSTLSSEQVIQLAPLLASELGFIVD